MKTYQSFTSLATSPAISTNSLYSNGVLKNQSFEIQYNEDDEYKNDNATGNKGSPRHHENMMKFNANHNHNFNNASFSASSTSSSQNNTTTSSHNYNDKIKYKNVIVIKSNGDSEIFSNHNDGSESEKSIENTRL